MPIISCADFARLAGVSRAAVTQAAKPKDGRPPKLALEADGSINTDLPINRTWLDAKRSGAKQSQPPAAQKRHRHPQGDTVSPPASQPPTQPVDDFEDVIANTIEASAEKLKLTKARRQQAEADTRLKDLRIAREKGISVARDLVRRKFSAFDASLKSNFRDMPRRIAAQVHAVALAGDARAVEAYLEKEISAAIGRAAMEAQKLDLI